MIANFQSQLQLFAFVVGLISEILQTTLFNNWCK